MMNRQYRRTQGKRFIILKYLHEMAIKLDVTKVPPREIFSTFGEGTLATQDFDALINKLHARRAFNDTTLLMIDCDT